MAANGMLGDLFAPKYKDLLQEERDDESLHRFQAADPFQAMAHATYAGSTLAGKGLGRAVAGAAGKDPRTPAERNLAAVEAAKAQVAQLGFQPDDPKSIDEFYKRVIQILQGQGLVSEAMAVAKEWNAKKVGDAKAAGEQAKLDLERDRLALARDKAYMADAVAWGKVQALMAKGVKSGAASQVGKILFDMKQTEDPAERRMLMRSIENLLGKGWKAVDTGGAVEIRDPTGKLLETVDKTATPRDEAKTEKAGEQDAFAYAEIKNDMQRQYDAVVQLHNHRGLDGIAGIVGRRVGTDSVVGDIAALWKGKDATGAAALHEQVVGGTFLSGLAKLKRASKTGATGLGAVSEKEGDKVQADAAALARFQSADDLRLRLREYAAQIVSAASRLDADAQAKEVQVIPLRQKQFTNARGRPAGAAPAAAPAPAATGGMDDAKKRRLEELRRKRDQGTLQ